MRTFILSLNEVDNTKLLVTGGKGANLGELYKIEGVKVPDGFCITTKAYKEIVSSDSIISKLVDILSLVKAEEQSKIAEISNEIIRRIDELLIPDDLDKEIEYYIKKYGINNGYAIRSSATAEDLPTASFAGMQDTFLNIIGVDNVKAHVKKCWASLFTVRAVNYRIKNHYDHRNVSLGVIIQKMVYAEASGVMFTADPLTSNRKIVSIDCNFGLGEVLVAGMVNVDNYKVYRGEVSEKKVATKEVVLLSKLEGGTIEHGVENENKNKQVLNDQQILYLEHIGRKIEQHFGCPQDIEWCLEKNIFSIVQSRPITTLFPIPDASDDGNHVYLSVGHQQMMTDPLRPLGMSIMEHVSFGKRYKAGGRLFVDISQMLKSEESREALLNNLKEHDPLMNDAVLKVIERGFIKCVPDDKTKKSESKTLKEDLPPISDFDSTIVMRLIEKNQASVERMKREIQDKTGVDLVNFIINDIKELKQLLFDPESSAVYMDAINATQWINDKIKEWLGEKNVADILSQSVSNNITSEMGLALIEIADKIRPYQLLTDFLSRTKDDHFIDNLGEFEGGEVVRAAIIEFLQKYGMRCSGEIDITRPRFSEKPTMLIPILISSIHQLSNNEGKLRFEQGKAEALEKKKQILNALTIQKDGHDKANIINRMITVMRNYIGYREYPKYGMVCRYYIYKQALLKEAGHLMSQRILQDKEDIYYLTLEELGEVMVTQKLNYNLINRRKEEYRLFERLTPPRVIPSDGDIIPGRYENARIMKDALVGLPVSSGIIEGRARVIMKFEDADIEEGDILVTTFTDPGWTPLFLTIKGLVTEVGGLMTHGAVIAREYGLPAVVGVENATKVIKDGQIIKVNGTDGYVEILSNNNFTAVFKK